MKAVFSVSKKAKLSNQNLIVGVDIGKKTNKGYCRTPDGQEVKPFNFDNNIRGFNKFWKTIQIAMERYKLKGAIVGFESSGSYGEPLQHFLKDNPQVHLVQVNPMHTKRVKELNDNSPNKSDKKDPRVIVDIIQLGHYLSCILPEGAAAELRNLSKEKSRGQLGPGHAWRLWEAAKNSLGIEVGLESICSEIRLLLQQIEQIEETVKQIEVQMLKWLEEVPYSQRLLSILRVCLVTVAGIIGEVADFNKFFSQKALMKLAGLNLYEISSGKHQGERPPL